MGSGVSWRHKVKLHELARGPVRVKLSPDDAARAALAKQLRLQSLPVLTADVTVTPWLDGVDVTGRFKAVVEQVCGVSLDAFEQSVEGDIDLRALPAGSPHAAAPEGGEVELDADAPDAPDILDADAVDVAAIVAEHLALEIDPFPRKPGATFDYQAPEHDISPFAALKKLQEPKG